MKKIVVLAIIFTTLFGLSLGGYQAFKIFQIKEGYVEFNYSKEDGVAYQLTHKRPRGWVKLDDLSPKAYSAIVISEDWAFFEHKGIDYNQLQLALIDMIEGRRTRGASTISQQLIKNVFTSGERNIKRKLIELFGTVILEELVSKEKILESYLNVIQYGDGIYGIENASRHYFKKSARKLNAKEGAFLAMLLPSPVRYSQSFKERKLTQYASSTINSIIDKMAVAKYISKDEAIILKNQRLSFEKIDVLEDVFEYFNSL